MYRRLAIFAITLLAVATPSFAQSPVSVNIGGGVTFPQSDTKHSFGTGGNFQFGAVVRLTPMVKFQVQYDYLGLGSKSILPNTATPNVITSIPLTANHTTHAAEFNFVLGQSLKDKKAAPYGVVGIGYYHEIVNLTTPSVGVGTVCDPWFYVCYPTAVPIDQILAQRTANEFGINVGGGVSLRLSDTAKFYTEIRYIHTYGPTITTSTGSIKANGNYWPLTFGIRLHSGY